ncbi:MAG: DivIVA domain-containing protein [Symbiobacteriia bacterium]
MLTPLDIHQKEFKKGFRGYVEEEVDEFLDEIMRDFESLIREGGSLRDEIESLRGKLESYARLETTLNSTLTVAQRTAEDVKANARKEAEVVIAEAKAQGEQIVQAAQKKAGRIADEFEATRREIQMYRAKMRSLVKSQLELLEDSDREDHSASRQVAATQEK